MNVAQLCFMANRKKYHKRVRKNLLMEEEDLFFIQDYCTIWGISDTDFINKAIKEHIQKLKQNTDGDIIRD